MIGRLSVDPNGSGNAVDRSRESPVLATYHIHMMSSSLPGCRACSSSLAVSESAARDHL